MPQLLPIVGIMVLMITFVVYQIYKIRWLNSHGRQVIVMVTSIRHETGKTAWGLTRDNYYITATWTNPRTGRTHTLWAWSINSCPAYTKGSLVPAMIDPKNPQRFVLDL